MPSGCILTDLRGTGRAKAGVTDKLKILQWPALVPVQLCLVFLVSLFYGLDPHLQSLMQWERPEERKHFADILDQLVMTAQSLVLRQMSQTITNVCCGCCNRKSSQESCQASTDQDKLL